jgi:hypothetical protein
MTGPQPRPPLVLEPGWQLYTIGDAPLIDVISSQRTMTTGYPETYLGDGLYASFDGNAIWLRAPRADGTDHVVALERDMMQTLGSIADGAWPGWHPSP